MFKFLNFIHIFYFICTSHIQLISQHTCNQMICACNCLARSILERPSFRFSDHSGTVQPQNIAQIIVSICGREHTITWLGGDGAYIICGAYRRRATAMDQSHRGVIVHSGFLVRGAASRSKWFFTFRRNMSPLSCRTERPIRDDLELLTIIF